MFAACCYSAVTTFSNVSASIFCYILLLSIKIMESRAPFERERDALLDNVSQGLEQVITNMAHLNRNLETINTIGKDFDNVASLWREFHAAIVTDSNASNGNEEHST
jgi:chlorite dismutase